MPAHLLETKFHLPPLSPRRIPRPRLLEKLDEGLRAGKPLTLISAPPGFGKSTAAAEWVASLDMPVAWLSLDSGDDEPGRFFTYLVAALQKVQPGLGSEIEALLNAGQLPPAEIICSTLVNELLRLPGRLVLVLDDVQVLQARPVLDFLKILVANLPPALHLVLLTRQDPPLPLARLRANALLTELRAADLRFTQPEAADFLNQGMGLGLSAADLEALELRTEGWIAGLQLAGLSMRDLPDPSRFIATLSGSHRHILGYLTDEVLSRQPEDVQRFLLQTSILERLSGELCEAVTERPACQALLEQLYDANLFLVPLDDERRWYRYHHLFAGLLGERLHALHKTEIPTLRQRAAEWYARACAAAARPDEKAEYATQAVSQALAGGDYAAAVRLIEDNALSLIVQWYARTVESWIAALPPEWRARSPKANLAFAWNYLLHGQIEQANPYILKVSAFFGSSPQLEDPALQAEWLALQAFLLNAQGQPQACLELSARALEQVPEDEANARSLIHMTRAMAFQVLDDYPHAAGAFRSLIDYGRRAGNLVTELLGIAALGQIATFRGQYRSTFELVSQGLEHMQRSGALHPISTALYGELGEAYYQWNQLAEAKRAIQRAVEVSTLSGYGHAAVYSSVLLSRLLLREGRISEAQEELRKTGAIDRSLEPGLLTEEIAAQQVRVSLAQGNLAEAERAFASLPPAQGAAFDYHAGSRGNIDLRLRLYRAQACRDPHALAEGIQAAGDLLAQIESGGYLPLALETLLLRARLHAACGDLPASLADVRRALELAQPEGVISIFVEEGQSVAELLGLLLEGGKLEPQRASYAHEILAAFPLPAPLPASRPVPQDLVEPLTERELSVLQHVAQGQTYAQIAASLVVSINTVRTHVRSIYGKLGANNRTAAIETARNLKLLQ